MCTYLKNMEGYKLQDLKFKEFDSIQEMFDRAFKRVNTFEYFRTKLVEGKEKRAGTELIQENAKKQKMENDKETAEVKQYLEITLDEKEVVDLTGDEDPTDEDVDIGLGDSTGVLAPSGDEISLGGKKLRESDIGGGTIAGKAIITWDSGMTSYAYIYGSSCKGGIIVCPIDT
ncbi:hypothetical protein Tco_0721860 [Tanacetum coccineum]